MSGFTRFCQTALTKKFGFIINSARFIFYCLEQYINVLQLDLTVTPKSILCQENDR